MNNQIIKIFFEELFYVSFILWLVFMALEFIFSGFVANFFNPHIALIIAGLSAIITLLISQGNRTRI